MIRKLHVKEMEGAEVQAADQLSEGYLIIMRIYCSCGVPKTNAMALHTPVIAMGSVNVENT